MSSELSRFEIVFHKAKGRYYEGDVLTGEVIVELKKDIVIESLSIIFRGTAIVRWRRRRKSKSDANLSNDEEHYLNQMVSLYTRESNPQQEILVSAGSHKYPFSIQLPDNMPSTFVGEFGVIRYIATAVLERPFQSPICSFKEFSICSFMDLNSQPDCMEPVSRELSRRHGGCCCSGSVRAVWRLDKTGYVPADKIEINGEIDNDSRTAIRGSKAYFIQHIRYNDSAGNTVYQRRNIDTIEKGELLPGNTEFWRESFSVPHLPPTARTSCNLIQIWYSLKLRVFSPGVFRSLKTDIEVTIGTAARRLTSQPFVSRPTVNPSNTAVKRDSRIFYFLQDPSNPDNTPSDLYSYFV